MQFSATDLNEIFHELFLKCSKNVVEKQNALEGCEGLRIFEEPIFGYASANDPLFLRYKDPGIIGEPYMTPVEWLPQAKSVVSFFLPFTQRVKKSNHGSPENTSNEWLHGRIEGQACLNEFTELLQTWFSSQGIQTCIPALDPRFKVRRTPLEEGNPEGIHFSSAWSERHAAFAAGLGTFSLTRGVITKKGMAGRFGSIIVSAELEATERTYTEVYEHCIRCGACMARCPVKAISLEGGKNQRLCSAWVNEHTAKVYAPRYGCGKCQTGVPCESRNPARR